MNLLALAGTIGQIVSTLPGLIRAVEQLFPGSKRGADKLQSVLGAVRETLEQIPELVDHAEALADALKPAIAGIVETFNKAGIFERSDVPMDEPDAPPVGLAPPLGLEPEPVGGSERRGKASRRVGKGPEEGAP